MRRRDVLVGSAGHERAISRPHPLWPTFPPPRAVAALRGLAVGDALGSQFFVPDNLPLHRREVPLGPRQWTDDTEMAAPVVAVLACHGHVDQDALAASFAAHHDFDRGYGPAVNRMLRLNRQEGGDWRELASSLFDGQGSWGDGGAVRVVPLGTWFADDPGRAADEGGRSAEVTHRHLEAVAGTRAVAAAAALVAADGHSGPPAAATPSLARGSEAPAPRKTRSRCPPTMRRPGQVPPLRLLRSLTAETLLTQVQQSVPRSAVLAGLRRAVDLLDYADVSTVAAVLGCGRHASTQDAVPSALWSAARHLGDFREALWTTAAAGGDADTTCAIVGGIVASGGLGAAPPQQWDETTEVFPAWPREALERNPTSG